MSWCSQERRWRGQSRRLHRDRPSGVQRRKIRAQRDSERLSREVVFGKYVIGQMANSEAPRPPFVKQEVTEPSAVGTGTRVIDWIRKCEPNLSLMDDDSKMDGTMFEK